MHHKAVLKTVGEIRATDPALAKNFAGMPDSAKIPVCIGEVKEHDGIDELDGQQQESMELQADDRGCETPEG